MGDLAVERLQVHGMRGRQGVELRVRLLLRGLWPVRLQQLQERLSFQLVLSWLLGLCGRLQRAAGDLRGTRFCTAAAMPLSRSFLHSPKGLAADLPAQSERPRRRTHRVAHAVLHPCRPSCTGEYAS